MRDFKIEEFLSAMNDFMLLIGKHLQDWETNLSQTNSLADQCKSILERLKGQIERILEKCAVADSSLIERVWTEVVRQVREHGFVLGTHFDWPQP